MGIECEKLLNAAGFIRVLEVLGWRVMPPHDRDFSAAQERCPPE